MARIDNKRYSKVWLGGWGGGTAKDTASCGWGGQQKIQQAVAVKDNQKYSKLWGHTEYHSKADNSLSSECVPVKPQTAQR